MASKNKLVAVKYGHKTIGVYIFFSIAGIRRLGDIIVHIQHNDEEKELAIRDLIHLHNRLVYTISSSNEDSCSYKDWTRQSRFAARLVLVATVVGRVIINCKGATIVVAWTVAVAVEIPFALAIVSLGA